MLSASIQSSDRENTMCVLLATFPHQCLTISKVHRLHCLPRHLKSVLSQTVAKRSAWCFQLEAERNEDWLTFISITGTDRIANCQAEACNVSPLDGHPQILLGAKAYYQYIQMDLWLRTPLLVTFSSPHCRRGSTPSCKMKNLQKQLHFKRFHVKVSTLSVVFQPRC